MAVNTKNKYPADKAGTQYAGFKNTKRTPPGKSQTERSSKESNDKSEQTAAGKTS